MDSSAFNRMDFSGIWWLFFFAAIGLVSLALGAAYLIIHLVHHIKWIS
jgi:hypothetical protein